MKKSVVLVEMGLRDGLQNEKVVLPPEFRINFVQKLAEAGLRRIEVGAFVSPKWVPQMQATDEVLSQLFQLQKQKKLSKKIEMAVLVPNEQGMQEALKNGAKEVAIFAAASESFSLKNINCTIEESFQRFEAVIKIARANKIKVRAYLSTCFGCPFEGKVSEAKVIRLAERLHKLGAYEISIGDTIGVANVGQVESLFRQLKKVIPVRKLAGHFHDTRGQALANILAAYKLGIHVFDTSTGGLGGCPYAPGATGNVSTEDVAFMFHGMGVKTGVQLEKLIEMGPWLTQGVQHPLPSRLSQVGLLKPLGKVVRS